ncbi:MAG: hypothetical protein A3E85_03710 [Gammaproteobacteria bacterium RIFCSPHIGHO2_12_FULL_45_12]|nr:MAG: hypothetical protein A3E85_03710 [Gammaproteobacteria bacterium RIFCSPHIGHO2_12_FULL_45_12]
MSFSLSEIAVILLIALLVVKPEQMPEMALHLGRFAKMVRRVFAKVKHEMNGMIESVEKLDERKP